MNSSNNKLAKRNLFFTINSECFMKKPELGVKYVASYLDLAFREYITGKNSYTDMKESDIRFFERCQDGFFNSFKNLVKGSDKKNVTVTYVCKMKMYIFMVKQTKESDVFKVVVYEIQEGKEVDTNSFDLRIYADMYDEDHANIVSPFDFENSTISVKLDDDPDGMLILEKVTVTGDSYATEFIQYMKDLNEAAANLFKPREQQDGNKEETVS